MKLSGSQMTMDDPRMQAAEAAREQEARMAGRALLIALIESAQKDALRCIDLSGWPNTIARAARSWIEAETDPVLNVIRSRQQQFSFIAPKVPVTRSPSRLTFAVCCTDLAIWYPNLFDDFEALRRRMVARINAAWLFYLTSVKSGRLSDLAWPEPARPDDPQDLRLLVAARARRLLQMVERRRVIAQSKEFPLFAPAGDSRIEVRA